MEPLLIVGNFLSLPDSGIAAGNGSTFCDSCGKSGPGKIRPGRKALGGPGYLV
jgi:hypothetical protein